MGRGAYQAPLCAIFVLAFCTLDSVGMSRVEPRGFRPANLTSYTQPQQKQWQPLQQHQQQPHYGGQQPQYATTRNPHSQQWSNGGGANYNQWNHGYNQSAIGGGGAGGLNNNKNWNTYNQTLNPWQRLNNTAAGQTTNNWNVVPQRPFQNQSHLYPQLPNSDRRQPNAPSSPPRFNNQWNQTQYPGGNIAVGGGNNWWPTQNKTWSAPVATTPLPTYMRPGQNNQNNWWNHTKNSNNNNAGWNSPTNGGGSNPGQTTWAGWGSNNAGQNNPPGWGSSTAGLNNLPNNGQNNWPNANNNNNANNNWSNNNQGSGGAQLAPLGGNSVPATGGQLAPFGTSSNSGLPLAPLGGGWNAGNTQPNPNAWNHGSSVNGGLSSGSVSGSAQLAPLAPLSYGGGGGGNAAVDPNRPNGGSSNPYANMFN